jgi:glycerol-3-phosphate acyltransferase PlsY
MIAALIAAYLIGSIPFALIVSRRRGVADPRNLGSGNLGAANVLRISGIRAGAAVALLDIAKGVAAVVVAQRLDGSAAPAGAGLAAVVGHIYPVWLGFRGGKGVATAGGAFAVLTPFAVAPALVIFTAAVWATRYVSFGSLAATVALPPLAYATGGGAPVVVSALAVATLIVFRHRSNLSRLRAGTERRLETGARS